MELQATRYAPRLLRGIPLVERPERMDVQVVQHDANLLGAWVVFVDQLSQTLGDIQLGTLLGDLDVPPSPMWLEEGKQVARPVALVFSRRVPVFQVRQEAAVAYGRGVGRSVRQGRRWDTAGYTVLHTGPGRLPCGR